MNPYQGNANTTNAAGTNEPLSTHVACIVIAAGVGVLLLRLANFKFVVAGGANASVGIG